jgi:RNA polymerase-binding transcription factor DksA
VVWKRALGWQRKRINAALGNPPDGLCEQCGEAIPAPRLYAVPWARKCFRCETARPQEKELLLRCGAAVPLDWD